MGTMEQLQAAILAEAERQGISGVNFTVIRKENDMVLTGLSIQKHGQSLRPLLYIDSYIGAIMDGESVEKMARDILHDYQKCETRMKLNHVNPETFFENPCPRLVLEPANAEMNAERFKNAVTFEVEGIILALRLNVMDNFGSILITEQLLDSALKMTGEQAITAAARNLEEKTTIAPLHEDDNSPIGVKRFIVSTNEEWGAAGIFISEKIRRRVREAIGSDYYIIPCSTHAVIVTSVEDNASVDEMRMLLGNVNHEVVSPHERLSNDIFFVGEDFIIRRN